MKRVQEFEQDGDGRLCDPRVRAAMERFAGEGDLAAFEAGAAVRTAQHAVARLRA